MAHDLPIHKVTIQAAVVVSVFGFVLALAGGAAEVYFEAAGPAVSEFFLIATGVVLAILMLAAGKAMSKK